MYIKDDLRVPSATIAGVFTNNDYHILKEHITTASGIQQFRELPGDIQTAAIFFRQSRSILLESAFMTIPIIAREIPSSRWPYRGVSVDIVHEVGSLTKEFERQHKPHYIIVEHGEQMEQYSTEVLLMAFYGLMSGIGGAVLAEVGKDIYDSVKTLVKGWRERKRKQDVPLTIVEIAIEVEPGRLIVIFNPDLNSLDGDLDLVRKWVFNNRDKFREFKNHLVDLEGFDEGLEDE